MNEQWKPIPTLDGMYEASTEGRIRNTKTKKIKAQSYDGRYLKFGYWYKKDGEVIQGWYRTHKAVAETFLDNVEGKLTVNHIDGNRKNNAVSNLEWATYKEQSIHARDVLKANCGENNYAAKHTNAEVIEMRRLYDNGLATIKELSVQFNDSIKNTRRIVKRERWKNI